MGNKITDGGSATALLLRLCATAFNSTGRFDVQHVSELEIRDGSGYETRSMAAFGWS